MANIRQYIEVEMDIKPVAGLDEHSFAVNLTKWDGETELECAGYYDDENGSNVFNFVCGFFVDADYEAWSEDPDGMGWGHIDYYEIDGGWYEQSEAEKDVLDFITSCGYEVVRNRTLSFNDNYDGFDDENYDPLDREYDKYAYEREVGYDD